jgi:hypothetical protein
MSMKVQQFITGVETFDVGAALVNRLGGICPEGARSKSSFDVTLYDDDPRLPRLFAELRQAGLKQSSCNQYAPGFIRGKHYSSGRVALYEDSDLNESRYLSIRPDFYPRFEEENSDEPNPTVRLLTLQQPLKGLLAASTSSDHLLLTRKGRLEVEQQGISGAVFAPAFFIHPDTHDIHALLSGIAAGKIPDFGEPPLWEVRPTVALPPMLPLKYRHHVNGEDRLSRNQIDVDRRMAYAKSDLDGAGPFDFASPSPTEDKAKSLVDPYIVSQRVFQILKKQKDFEISAWTPVREE